MARISLALFMAGFATFSLIYSAQPLLPEFTAEFGVDPATSSLALSLTTGCLAVSILCVGALSETWGRRGLMFASICGAALLNLVSSVAPTWEVLLVVRSLEGLVASRNKSHAASLYLLSYYFGSSILGSLGGWFWREGGWAAVVAFCSTLMMIVLGIAAKLRRGSDLSES
jgi:MFS family permease